VRLIEAAVNRAIHLDPDIRRRLGELEGKIILLEIAGDTAPLRVYVQPSTEGLRLTNDSDHLPDVTISGTPSVFLNQVMRGPTVSDELTLRGDIELGQRFQRTLRQFKPDWEEGLSRVVGDLAAHQIGLFARTLRRWGTDAARTLGRDAADYLTEESFVLAKRERVKSFLQDVDRLRADVDRLEQRLVRLARPI
jgi:ubiquinone biosynthesis protein UbiJ